MLARQEINLLTICCNIGPNGTENKGKWALYNSLRLYKLQNKVNELKSSDSYISWKCMENQLSLNKFILQQVYNEFREDYRKNTDDFILLDDFEIYIADCAMMEDHCAMDCSLLNNTFGAIRGFMNGAKLLYKNLPEHPVLPAVFPINFTYPGLLNTFTGM
jgi:hypothetical protein